MQGRPKDLAKITPMMQQYLRMKKEYPDTVLFFRMGDFYETFYEDAKITSEALGITLTSRDKKGDERIPLAGIPYHALDTYLSKMIEKGFKVAICEQVEDPKKAVGVVKREVIRVVTPGTVIEEKMLSAKSNNYLMGLVGEKGNYGIAFVDVSTGEFFTTELTGEDALNRLLTELIRFKPSELIMPSSLFSDKDFLEKLEEQSDAIMGSYEDYNFEHEKACDTLKNHFNILSLKGMGCEDKPLAVRASGGVLAYVIETQKASVDYIDGLNTYSTSDYMVLDATTLRNLEVLRNIRDRSTKGTLLEILDRCSTSMGSRLMKKWIQQPLLDINEIRKRQDAVEDLVNSIFLRQDLRDILKDVRDLERLISRTVYGSANARDLQALKESLSVIPEIKERLSEKEGVNSEMLKRLYRELDELPEIVGLLDRAIVPDPPLTVREGGMIKKGYNEDLDRLRSASKDGKSWLKQLEKREQRRTKIKSLKVKYNKVFGYYIEVTKSNLHLVPEDYIRKQTLVNAERFITPELKEMESTILSADEKSVALEYELFTDVREKVSKETKRVQKTARAVAALDVIVSLAEVAVDNNYVRPDVNDSDSVAIKDGRHPVVERMLYGSFIPNDSHLDNKQHSLIILTGPNMSGKSTYMRQIALITIMAQTGSFVPAASASIGIVDRVFTRVGAFDDLSRGQSTFMVEMLELANILNNATPRSLILLDEIGRGTSTFDGLSIAWAVTEYIHDKKRVGAKTLFATHYHHLTELAELLDGVVNYHVAVREQEDDIVFLRKVVPGGTDKSYGVQVAKLAGVPHEVVSRAKSILRTMERESRLEIDKAGKRQAKGKSLRPARYTQLVLFDANPVSHPALEELKRLDIENLTPVQALQKLHDLKKKVE